MVKSFRKYSAEYIKLMWINWISKIILIEFIQKYDNSYVNIHKKSSCDLQRLEWSTLDPD